MTTNQSKSNTGPLSRFARTLAACAAGMAAAFLLATPAAHAQVGIYLGTAPPPLRYEARPAIPGPGYAWIDGYYEPAGRGYRWHPGYWQQPPYAGAYYVHPHYDHYAEGWRMHEGYWSHEDHDDHHWDQQRGDRHDGDRHDGDRRDGDHHDDRH